MVTGSLNVRTAQAVVTLNNGVAVPRFGSSIDMEPDGGDNAPVLERMLECGYKHIDASHAFDDISMIRKTLDDRGVDADKVRITAMLWPGEYRRGTTQQAIESLLDCLGRDHIDLLLQHQQFSNYVQTWHEMEEAYDAGIVRAIGLSGFEGQQLEILLANARIAPAVLQIECHPLCQQRKLKSRLSDYDTALMAKYALGHGQEEVLANETIVQIARECDKTAAQVIVRWHVQEGHIVMPKSTNAAHIEENAQIFDFSLSEEQMERIRALDEDLRLLLPMHRSLATPVVHHQVFRSAGSRTMAQDYEIDVSIGYGKMSL